MENKNCILLKNKEYIELIKQANEKKPDYINLSYTIDEYWMGKIRYSSKINSSLDLHHKLHYQIQNIVDLHGEVISKQIEENNSKVTELTKSEIEDEIKRKTFLELYKYWKLLKKNK